MVLKGSGAVFKNVNMNLRKIFFQKVKITVTNPLTKFQTPIFSTFATTESVKYPRKNLTNSVSLS